MNIATTTRSSMREKPCAAGAICVLVTVYGPPPLPGGKTVSVRVTSGFSLRMSSSTVETKQNLVFPLSATIGSFSGKHKPGKVFQQEFHLLVIVPNRREEESDFYASEVSPVRCVNTGGQQPHMP